MTVTVNMQDGPTIDVHVTVVTPFGNAKPEAGLHVTSPHDPLTVGAE